MRVCFAGNALVIAAILLERNLQNVANYLIVSLAVADLMVACLVMPLGAVYEVRSARLLPFLTSFVIVIIIIMGIVITRRNVKCRY